MRLIYKQYLDTPFYGSRRMTQWLIRKGKDVNRIRIRIRRLMQVMGLEAIYPRMRTSDPHPGHCIYPYLLRNLAIEHCDHVWSTDITYIPLAKGFVTFITSRDGQKIVHQAGRVPTTVPVRFVRRSPLLGTH